MLRSVVVIYEVQIQEVDPARRDEYMNKYSQSLHAANLPGCDGGMIMKCIEEPGRVLVLIGWDSVEAHKSCTKTEAHAKFKDGYKGYQTAPSIGGHYFFQEM